MVKNPLGVAQLVLVRLAGLFQLAEQVTVSADLLGQRPHIFPIHLGQHRLEHLVQLGHEGVLLVGRPAAAEQPVQQQGHGTEPFIEGCRPELGDGGRGVLAVQDGGYIVVGLVLAVEVQVVGKVLGNGRMLEVLGDD